MSIYARRNQKRLSPAAWEAFIGAVDATRKPNAVRPTYREFVVLHEKAMSHQMMNRWRVHTMGSPDPDTGRNFLAWHRIFLLRFEERLRLEDPSVSIPYWNWARDPQPPQALSKAALLRRWRVDRDVQPDAMPDEGDVGRATRRPRFKVFQQRTEGLHNWVHSAVGGVMLTARSPADPLFWLHHANIDRIWARWQEGAASSRPGNGPEELQPRSFMGKSVTRSLDIGRLGYRYS